MAYQIVSAKRIRTVRVTPRGSLRIPIAAVLEFIDGLESVSQQQPAA
jgi:hypothetical protein